VMDDLFRNDWTAILITGKPAIVLGIVTTLPAPVYPEMVTSVVVAV
jgi:hypothetical protein